MSVGSTIRHLRTSAGLRQADLASLLDVSTNYISLVENDRRDPSLGFLRSMSAELGVTIGVFLLDTAYEHSDLPAYERLLVNQIRNMVLEIEDLRLQRQAEGDLSG